MLGLLACATLREHGFDKVYCSGTREARSEFIDRFGGTPLYNGKYTTLLAFHSHFMLIKRKSTFLCMFISDEILFFLSFFFLFLFRKAKYERSVFFSSTNYLCCVNFLDWLICRGRALWSVIFVFSSSVNTYSSTFCSVVCISFRYVEISHSISNMSFLSRRISRRRNKQNRCNCRSKRWFWLRIPSCCLLSGLRGTKCR